MRGIFFLSPLAAAVLIIGGILFLGLGGLFLFRRWMTPRIVVSDGFNDGISGVVGAVGLFYGITVGLIAVTVWNTWSSDADLVSKEAAAISALYRDVSGLPEPARTEMSKELKEYTEDVVQQEWPTQRKGEIPGPQTEEIGQFQKALMAFQPASEGERARYGESLAAYNGMLQLRALRIEAVGGGLSDLMWLVILGGAVISISSAYLFHFPDAKLHMMAVGLIAAFLGLMLFVIVLNDHPFIGTSSIGPESYQLVHDRLMAGPH